MEIWVRPIEMLNLAYLNMPHICTYTFQNGKYSNHRPVQGKLVVIPLRWLPEGKVRTINNQP